MFSKAKQLKKTDRLREPIPKKTERLRESAPKNTERLREPVPKKTVRLRDKVVKKTERLRPKAEKKKERIKESPFKDKDYVHWMHCQNFGCLVCGSTAIEAHHVLRGVDGRPDDSIVSLCNEHHHGRYSPHGFDSNRFSSDYPKDVLLEIAKRLYESYRSEAI